MNELFKYGINSPYEQFIGIQVKDHGNGLPITIGCINGDPSSNTDVSMTVHSAEVLSRKLKEAIEIAKKAKL